MKKTALTILCLIILTTNAFAGGSFTKDSMNDFTLHTYLSDDPMGDVSFLIETKNALVVLEPQAFTKNIEEFTAYTDTLNKPVEMVLVSFHAGGLSIYTQQKKTTTIPMDGFMKSEHGKGMLAYFDEAFKGAMDTKTVDFDSVIAPNATVIVDGVTYQFMPTDIPGMPGSQIAINNTVLFQHFAPAANTHASPFHVKSKETIEGALIESRKAQEGNYALIIGSHCPGKGTQADIDFQITYFETLKKIVAKADNAETMIAEMNAAYPTIQGEKNLQAIAARIYQ